MRSDPLAALPADQRELARSAISTGFGSARVTALQAITGGASGALTYRIEVDARAYLLRIEAGRQALQNRFPKPAFSYLDLVSRMFAFVHGSNVFAPGLLDRHRTGLERIRDAYPWDDAAHVATHNDPNPRNILFDGTRLWLVDWEGSHRNDALTDVAVVTHELAGTPELQELLLRSWLGRDPDRVTRARLTLMRQVTRAFYAGVIFRQFAGDPRREPDSGLVALTPAAFVAAIQAGRLRLGSPEVLYEFGKMFLAGFSDGLTAPDFEESLAVVAGG